MPAFGRILTMACLSCLFTRVLLGQFDGSSITNNNIALFQASAASLSVIGWGAVGNDDNGPFPVDFGQVVVGDYRAFYTPLAPFSSVSPPSIPTTELTNLLQTAETVAIACGELHTLLLRRDGSLLAKGWNGAGQSVIPDGLSNVVSIACGTDHNLAIKTDGSVVGWGWNDSGQVDIPIFPTNVVAVAGGAHHSLALLASGTVVCWGGNELGQCDVPENVTNAIGIAAGAFHSLALLTDHTVVAWGRNDLGQASVPSTLKNVTAISAGFGFSLALLENGRITAWGDQSNDLASPPERLTNVIQIAAGEYHALALTTDGTVHGWGDDEYDALAFPTNLTHVAAIAAGGYHSEVLLQSPNFLTPPTSTYRGMEMDLNIPAGRRYLIETSVDLKLWEPAGSGTAVPGRMHLVMPTDTAAKYFRLKLP